MLKRMYLSIFTQKVYQVVSVSCQTRNHAIQMLVDSVDLLRNFALLQQERSLMFLGGQHNTFFGDNA